MAQKLLFQIDEFTSKYHEADKLDNDYDKYNMYFSELSCKLPGFISYKFTRCRLIVTPRIKMYGFTAQVRDRIMKHKGEDKRMLLHVGIFNRRDAFHGHSAILIFDTLRQIQYYYDPLAYVGDNSEVNAYMASTPLLEGFKCSVLMAPFSHHCIQKLIEPSNLRNCTCGLVCVLVSLCFMYNLKDFSETLDALTCICTLNPDYMQRFMLRFASYYNEQVCDYDI